MTIIRFTSYMWFSQDDFYPCRYCKDGLVTKEIAEQHQKEFEERLKEYGRLPPHSTPKMS